MQKDLHVSSRLCAVCFPELVCLCVNTQHTAHSTQHTAHAQPFFLGLARRSGVNNLQVIISMNTSETTSDFSFCNVHRSPSLVPFPKGNGRKERAYLFSKD